MTEFKTFEWKHFDLKIKDKGIASAPPATAQCENADENMQAYLSIAIVSMTLRKHATTRPTRPLLPTHPPFNLLN